ncbi:ABC transporter ATP-binding protein [Hymenobacter fodinae]|uniref:ATP-binding cassette domain-containing protein n=1 Tax=Hymenobacter fodinae TaxID=2510796 RepID=A0A4Z0P124_9BACT|nr:ATP-binding cassette domain-containing protein [Hymenobacter fodinae]TGE04246.1 ATP-binding cassette domain-containing protein [Hymenobacter fodinae]
MTSSSPLAIQATQLSKRYGPHAVVQNVSFALPAGETLVLLGPSGCGKTTLLRMLNRLVEPDEGSVAVQGQDVRTQSAAALRRGIGYVIQQVGLLPHYTVAENVGVVPRLLGQEEPQVAARTEELLRRLHLPPERFAGLYPHQLSGGQQQRVGLARALAADPPIILLDEPFGALDPITRASIRREFRELEELRRKTVVLVTHDVTEAFELADRIMLLNAGQVQQLGTPKELLFRPANEFVRRFFDAEKFSLQLRTLRLADVMTYIPNEVHNNSLHTYKSADKVLPLSVTIQEAIEALSSPSGLQTSAEEEAVVWVEAGNSPSATAYISLTLPQLMTAFGRALQDVQTA